MYNGTAALHLSTYMSTPLCWLHPGIASKIIANKVIFSTVHHNTTAMAEDNSCSTLETVDPVTYQLNEKKRGSANIKKGRHTSYQELFKHSACFPSSIHTEIFLNSFIIQEFGDLSQQNNLCAFTCTFASICSYIVHIVAQRRDFTLLIDVINIDTAKAIDDNI